MDTDEEDAQELQDNTNRSFRTAIRSNDVATIQEMINDGFAVDTLIYGESGLHIAISHGLMNAVTVLMNEHASLELFNESGNSPLMTAVLSDETDCRQNGRHMGIFDVLVKKLKSIDPAWHLHKRSNVSRGGKTLLMLACEGGSVHMIRYFLKNGFDPRAVDQKRRNSLHHFATRGFADSNQGLHGVISMLVKSPGCKQPLHIAVKSVENIEQVIKPLLKHGANVECTNNKMQTPLHLAGLKGQDNIIAYLCSEDVCADVWAEDERGRTPLHCVLSGEKSTRRLTPTEVISIAELLAEHLGHRRRSSYYNKPDNEGMTPFLLSCGAFGVGIMTYFLNSPLIDVNAVTHKGDTALHIAMHSQFEVDVFEKLNLLLPRISCIHRCNKNGETPMTIANGKMVLEGGQDYARDIELMENSETRKEASSLAFAMGLHPRLGEGSSVDKLDLELVRMVQAALHVYLESEN
jgi:ankyrin repeat protein